MCGGRPPVTSGWDRLNSRIVRAKTVVTNDVTFEGINTTSTTNYPAGTGTGSIRRITAWTNLSQITNAFATGGGDQNFADITSITDTVQKQIPTTRAAITVTLPFYYDPALSWFAPLVAIGEAATPVAFRASFPNTSKLVGNAYWSVRKVPTVEDSTLRSEATVSFAADPVVYAT